MKLFLICLMLSVLSIFHQSVEQKDIKVIREFISESCAKDPDNRAILSKYFPAKYEKQKDKRGISIRDSVHNLVIKAIQDKLRGTDLSKITITPYKKLQKAEVKIAPIQGSQIYVVKLDNRLIFNALMNDNELISVITMNKGGVGVFAVY